MDILDNVKDIVNDNEEWWLVKVEQPNIPDVNFIKGVFRATISSNYSIGGIKNFNFFKRFLLGGFHISFTKGDTGIMMMFCRAKKTLDKNFLHHFMMRYQNAVGLSIPKVSLTLIKPTDEDTSVYSKMNEYVNTEINKVFENGDIPKIHMRKFGIYSKSSNNFNT